MRAVVIREFGPPRVLEPAEVQALRPGPGEVVIDVEFANVTFVETQVRAGKAPHQAMLPALPAVLGNGVGGTVASDGQNAATERAGTPGGGHPGRRVVASLNGTGGYAERAVVPAARLIEVPDEVSLREAVALLADGRTAFSLVARADVRAGDTVLVEAAGGGVGTLLVQIGRNAGARVVAVAGAERKLALARDLGADLTVDYGRGDWAQRVREAVGEVDVVFDGVGGEIGLAAFGLLGAGGRFCPFGMASGSFAPVTPDLARAHQVSVRAGGAASPEELMALVRTALTEAAAGRIRPVIGQEFDMAAAAEAHAAIEARTTLGKTLLTVATLSRTPGGRGVQHRAGQGAHRRRQPSRAVGGQLSQEWLAVQRAEHEVSDHAGVGFGPLRGDKCADVTVPEPVDRVIASMIASRKASSRSRSAVPGPSGGGPAVTACSSALARSTISAYISPVRLPNRWNTVPLPTPAAAATCSIEMSCGR